MSNENRQKFVIPGTPAHSATAILVRRASKYNEQVGESQGPYELIKLDNVPVKASAIFPKSELILDNKSQTHDIVFEDAKIVSIQGDELPYGIKEIKFTEEGAPTATFSWGLNNKEVESVIRYGALGTEHDIDPDGPAPRAKGPFKLADIYQQVVFTDLPVKVNVVAMKEAGKADAIPIACVEICDAENIRVNSRITGYGDIITDYCRPVEYLEPGAKADVRENFIELDNNRIIGVESTKTEEKVDELPNVIPADKVLSPEEQAELDIRTDMRGRVDEITANTADENQVDMSVETADNVEVPASSIIEPVVEPEPEPVAKPVSEFVQPMVSQPVEEKPVTYIGEPEQTAVEEEMPTEVLEEMHLINPVDSEEAAAKAEVARKLQQKAMEDAAVQAAQINEATTKGETVIEKENRDERAAKLANISSFTMSPM